MTLMTLNQATNFCRKNPGYIIVQKINYPTTRKACRQGDFHKYYVKKLE